MDSEVVSGQPAGLTPGALPQSLFLHDTAPGYQSFALEALASNASATLILWIFPVTVFGMSFNIHTCPMSASALA